MSKYEVKTYARCRRTSNRIRTRYVVGTGGVVHEQHITLEGPDYFELELIQEGISYAK